MMSHAFVMLEASFTKSTEDRGRKTGKKMKDMQKAWLVNESVGYRYLICSERGGGARRRGQSGAHIIYIFPPEN